MSQTENKVQTEETAKTEYTPEEIEAEEKKTKKTTASSTTEEEKS